MLGNIYDIEKWVKSKGIQLYKLFNMPGCKYQQTKAKIQINFLILYPEIFNLQQILLPLAISIFLDRTIIGCTIEIGKTSPCSCCSQFSLRCNFFSKYQQSHIYLCIWHRCLAEIFILLSSSQQTAADFFKNFSIHPSIQLYKVQLYCMLINSPSLLVWWFWGDVQFHLSSKHGVLWHPKSLNFGFIWPDYFPSTSL